MQLSLREFENPSAAMLGFAPEFVVIYSVMIAVFIFIVIFVLEFFILSMLNHNVDFRLKEKRPTKGRLIMIKLSFSI